MRGSLWGIRRELTMIRRACDRDLKEARRLNSNVSTVMNGLTAMNGTIRSLNRGILFLNIKLTFYVVLYALMKFLRNIKRSMLGHEQSGLKKKESQGEAEGWV